MNRGLHTATHSNRPNPYSYNRGILYPESRETKSVGRRSQFFSFRLPNVSWKTSGRKSRTHKDYRQASSGKCGIESRDINSQRHIESIGKEIRYSDDEMASGGYRSPGRDGEQSVMTILSRLSGLMSLVQEPIPRFDESLAKLADDFREERASGLASLIESTSIKGAELSQCQLKLKNTQEEVNRWKAYAHKLEKECMKCGLNMPKSPDEDTN